MKAVINEQYGSPDILRLVNLEKPELQDHQIRINIRAVSLNGSDREGLSGQPFYARINGLRRPKNQILGSDIAGVVEAVGDNYTEFEPGDEVFGELPDYHGGLAEYVCTNGKNFMRKPSSLTFEQAAAIPQGGVIAYNAICKKGRVHAGQRVLINGAGGSAGSFAIPLAKIQGAEVTAVDNVHKLKFMQKLGADHVLDYTKDDFTQTGEQYDLILDLYGHRSVFATQRALRKGGRYFFVGGSMNVLFQALMGPLLKPITGKDIRLLAIMQNREDLISITELVEAGKIEPVIDRTFSLEDAPEAFRYMEEGRSRGKIVITV